MNITVPNKVFSEAEVLQLYAESYPKYKNKKKRNGEDLPPLTRQTPDGYYVAMDGDILAGWAGWKKLDGNTYLTAGSLTLPDYRNNNIQSELLWPKRDAMFGGAAVFTITNNKDEGWIKFVDKFYPKVTIDKIPETIKGDVQEALDFYEEQGKNPNIFYKGPTEDSAMKKAWVIIKGE
jgi:hypothetical protein